MLALLVLGRSLLEGAGDGGGLAVGFRHAYRSLAYTASTDPFVGGQGIDYWAMNWYAGAFWIALAFSYPLLLRTRKVYPLSRTELGRVTYWLGALHLS
ncbi:MAG: hypothetical protein V3T83_22425 [Acidobacteriota bacterium]